MLISFRQNKSPPDNLAKAPVHILQASNSLLDIKEIWRILTDDKTEPLLLQAYKDHDDEKTKDRTRERLVELYDAWGKPEQAAEWRAKAKPPAGEGPR